MKLLTFLVAILINFVVGATIGGTAGFDPVASGLTALGISVVYSCIPKPSGALFDVALLQAWESAAIEKLRFFSNWLDKVPSKNEYVGKNVINLTDIGADPDVLIDNTDYPIPLQDIDDDNIPVSLRKFQTKVTRVTDDEIYALPYDKEGSLLRRHTDAIRRDFQKISLHAFAPDEDKVKTPVVKTTGDDNGFGFKRLKSADIIELKRRLDKQEVPLEGRILVLSSQHISDLLLEDTTFRERYQRTATGQIVDRYYGFEIHEDVWNPVYDATFKKVAYGGTSATEREASVCLHVGRAFKAMGTLKAYYKSASINPQTQQSEFNYRTYMIARPTKAEALGAIVNDSVNP